MNEVERLARAMAAELRHHMMPDPHFDEPDDPFPDHDGAFGGRRGNGDPIMSLTPGKTLGQAKVEHYLEEREAAREFYLAKAAAILRRTSKEE